jgi:hypothetical protein
MGPVRFKFPALGHYYTWWTCVLVHFRQSHMCKLELVPVYRIGFSSSLISAVILALARPFFPLIIGSFDFIH